LELKKKQVYVDTHRQAMYESKAFFARRHGAYLDADPGREFFIPPFDTETEYIKKDQMSDRSDLDADKMHNEFVTKVISRLVNQLDRVYEALALKES